MCLSAPCDVGLHYIQHNLPGCDGDDGRFKTGGYCRHGFVHSLDIGRLMGGPHFLEPNPLKFNRSANHALRSTSRLYAF